MAKKIDIIIGHSNTDPTRDRNLKFIIQYYKKFLPNSKIIIVEQNTETDLEGSGVEHVVLKHNHGYSRSLGFNEGVRRSSADIYVLADNDCVLSPQVLNSIEDACKDYGYYIPYHWCHDLSPQETQMFLNGNTNVKGRPRGHQNEGGINFVTKEGYEAVGGFDPQFKGWGCEDSAFRAKCNRILKCGRGDGIMKHIFHNVVHAKGRNPEFKDNSRHWGTIRNMTKEETIRYVEELGTKHFKD